MQNTRAERERVLTNQGDVYQHWERLRRRFHYIFECPNSVWGDHVFNDMLRSAVAGKRVLEIGCGSGWFTKQLSQFGASYVYAVDISNAQIVKAKQHTKNPGLCEYNVIDVSIPFSGVFDVIIGQGVLHHLNYQEVLTRLIHENLSQNGLLFFYEPLGENWLIRLYHQFSKHSHTPDERPFKKHDLKWLHETFPGFTLTPINFVSLPLAAILSFIIKQPDNALLQGADRIDRFLARHARWIHPYFRCAIFSIRT